MSLERFGKRPAPTEKSQVIFGNPYAALVNPSRRYVKGNGTVAVNKQASPPPIKNSLADLKDSGHRRAIQLTQQPNDISISNPRFPDLSKHHSPINDVIKRPNGGRMNQLITPYEKF